MENTQMKTLQSGASSAPAENNIFWGEIAPSDHFVHFYDADDEVLDSLEEYVAAGIRNGEGVIVIALTAHLEVLEARLAARGVDLDLALSKDQYIPVDAEEFLSEFVVRGWPDEKRFNQLITDILIRARMGGRRVRAFGELVAILWSRGHKGATVRLEHLWHELCKSEAFSLYCAYPRLGFSQDASSSIREICEQHTAVIGGDGSNAFGSILDPPEIR